MASKTQGNAYEEVRPRYNTLYSNTGNNFPPEPIYGNNQAPTFNINRNGPLQAAILPPKKPAVPPRTYLSIDENGDIRLGGSSTRRRKRTLNKRKQKKRANRKTKRKSSTY